MRIIFPNNYYYLRGGSERVLFEEQALLKQNSHCVSGFSRKHPDNLPCEYSDHFAELVDIENLSGLAKIKQAFKLIKNKEAAKKFRLVLQDYKPDIVHAHNIYGGLTTSVLDVAKKQNIPSVITLHDCKLICPSYLMLNDGQVCEDCKGRKFINCLKNRCHKNSLVASAIYTAESYYNKWLRKWDSVRSYICPSHFMMDKMKENGLPDDKLVYVPNFVDPDNFKPSFDAGDYVLYVGRLSHEKGVLTLLKALKGTGIPLKIVGDGPVRFQAQDFVQKNQMNDVVFEGYKSGDELAELFRNAAFLAIPSECNENAPMAILEAYAYGKPVLGARIGGIPEMIIEGKTGGLFESGNARELNEKILAMWSSKENLSMMGQAARQRLQENYSPEIHYEKLIEVYNKALK